MMDITFIWKGMESSINSTSKNGWRLRTIIEAVTTLLPKKPTSNQMFQCSFLAGSTSYGQSFMDARHTTTTKIGRQKLYHWYF